MASGLGMALASLLADPALADFSGGAWQFFKPILVPSEIVEETLVEVVPDREVFVRADKGFADLRIIEVGNHQEVPYMLLVERGEERRSSIAVDVRDLKHTPGQFTSFVVDLGPEKLLHNELEVQSPSENFQRRVVVEGSQDSQTWAVLQDQGHSF